MSPILVTGRVTRRILAAATIAFGALPGASASPTSLDLIGQSGILGEWELTGTIAATGVRDEFAGPIVLKHTGICSADGPETRAGDMRLRLIGTQRVRATLIIDGTPCTYSATKTDGYSGMMSCRDRRDVPLRLWVKQ